MKIKKRFKIDNTPAVLKCILIFALCLGLCIPNHAQTNVALHKTAYQSSTAHGGVASRAVDGNTSGVWGQSSVTHTSNQANAWWEVDLGGEFDISSIDLYNRTDCCAERLGGFDIFVKQSKSERGSLFHGTKSSSGNRRHEFEDQQRGRYVRIQLRGSNYLSLAEVMVFGRRAHGGNSVSFITQDDLVEATMGRNDPQNTTVGGTEDKSVFNTSTSTISLAEKLEQSHFTITIESLSCPAKSGGEPGSENEYYGEITVRSLPGGVDDAWPNVLWKRGSDNAVDIPVRGKVNIGRSHNLGRITPNTSVVVGMAIKESDTFSDSNLGIIDSRKILLEDLPEGPTRRNLTLSSGGDVAIVTYVITRKNLF